MKKMLFALLLVTSASQAQNNSKYDKLFLETGLGAAFPFSSVSPSGDSNGSISLAHFNGGLRYMFDKNIGLLGTLSYDQFKDNDGQKSDQKLAGLEFCYNLGNGIGLTKNSRGRFGLLTHAGVAIGALSSKYDSRDKIGALLIGARPYVLIAEKISFFADLTYKATLQQDIYFNGQRTSYPNPGTLTGSQLGLTFGLVFALGKNDLHADSTY